MKIDVHIRNSRKIHFCHQKLKIRKGKKFGVFDQIQRFKRYKKEREIEKERERERKRERGYER